MNRKQFLKRKLSLVLAAVLLLTSALVALPLQAVAAETTNMKYGTTDITLTKIEDFTSTGSTQWSDGYVTGDKGWGIVDLEGSEIVLKSNWFQYYRNVNSGSMAHTSSLLQSASLSGVKHFALALRNTTATETHVSMLLETSAGDRCATASSLATYPVKLVPSSGTSVTTASTRAQNGSLPYDCFTVPAGFDGYALIPVETMGFTGAETSITGIRFNLAGAASNSELLRVKDLYTFGDLPAFEASAGTIIPFGNTQIRLNLLDDFTTETASSDNTSYYNWGYGKPYNGGVLLTTGAGGTTVYANGGFLGGRVAGIDLSSDVNLALSIKNLDSGAVDFAFEIVPTSGDTLRISSKLAALYPIYLVNSNGGVSVATVTEAHTSFGRAAVTIPQGFEGTLIVPKGALATSWNAMYGGFTTSTRVNTMEFFAVGNNKSRDILLVDDFYSCAAVPQLSGMNFAGMTANLTLVDDLTSVSMAPVNSDHGSMTYSGGRWLFAMGRVNTGLTSPVDIKDFVADDLCRYVVVSIENPTTAEAYFGFAMNNQSVHIPTYNTDAQTSTLYGGTPAYLVAENGTYSMAMYGKSDYCGFCCFPVKPGFKGYLVVSMAAFTGYTRGMTISNMTFMAYCGNMYVDNVYTMANLPVEKIAPVVDQVVTYDQNPGTVVANGTPVTVNAAIKDGVTGLGIPHITYRNAAGYAVAEPRRAGTYSVYISFDEGASYSALPETLLYRFTITCDHSAGDSNNDGRCDNCTATVGAAWVASSVTMGGDIGVNFYYELTGDIAADANTRVVFTLADGTVKTVPIAEAQVSSYAGSTCYVFSIHLAAKRMTDVIKAQLATSSGTFAENSYSVEQYAKAVLDAHTGDEYAENVAKSLLNYGAAAQDYFGYKTDDPANADLSATDRIVAEPTRFNVLKEAVGTVNGLTYAGNTMVFDYTITVRIYFTATQSIDRYTFTSGGKTLTPVEAGEYYYVEITDIAVSDLNVMQTVTATSGDQTMTVNYSAHAYIHDLMSDADANVRALVKSLYAYGEAAELYLASAKVGRDTVTDRDLVKMVTPFWESKTMFRESTTFHVRTDGSITAQLMYKPTKIHCVEDWSLKYTYVEGKDYVWNQGTKTLTWLNGSSIPYFRNELNGKDDAGNAVVPAYPGSDLFGSTMIGNALFTTGPILYTKQVAVTYEYEETRTFTESQYQGTQYSHVLDKLSRGEKVDIYVYGDSISWGCDSSASIGRDPMQGNWSQLLEQYLSYRYDNDNVTVVNGYSRPGDTSAGGLSNLNGWLNSATPDMVILSWGMNDSAYTAQQTTYNMRSMIQAIRAKNPNCDILLIAPFSINPDTGWPASTNNHNYPTYFKNLADEQGCAFANMYTIHTEMLTNNDYASFTGNNVNHPNDFLIRVYAMQILKTMFEEI